MFDLYELIVPLVTTLTLLNLLVIKLAIKENVTMIKISQKNQQPHRQKCQNMDQSPTKSTLKYLLLNFTPIEFFAVRRARYKLSLFFSMSIIIIGTYFVPSPYAFVAIGTIVYFTYFFINMAIARSDLHQNQSQQSTKYRQKYLQLLYTLASVLMNIIVIERVFKNYENIMLLTFLQNIGLNIVLDNFLVRPIMVTIIGLPLSRSTSFQAYLAECEQQVTLLDIYDKIGDKEMLKKIGKMISPSKIPKNIPLELEIEPTPYDGKKREDGYEKPYDVLKKFKKQRILPPINVNLHTNLQCTLNSLFNSGKKSHQQQNDYHIPDHPLEKKGSNQEGDLPVKRKVCSQNLIVINPSQQERIQNEEDPIPQEEIIGKKLNETENEGSDYQGRMRSSRRRATLGENVQPLKLSLHSSEHPTSRQQPLRICLNGEFNLDFQQNHNGQDEEVEDYRRRRQLITLDDSIKNSMGVLEIKEQNIDDREQIEEITLNSPERRRRHNLHVQLEEDSKIIGLKKKKKKYSQDNTNRVIKFSTGEPYLEYLPNMLSKETKGKKSQGLSRKEVIQDSRVINSVRRPPKKRINGDNTQNIVPQFKIEEL